jgi:hypothetical protein
MESRPISAKLLLPSADNLYGEIFPGYKWKHSTKESRRTLSHELEIDSFSAAINAPGKVMELSGLICVDEHFFLVILGRLRF